MRLLRNSKRSSALKGSNSMKDLWKSQTNSITLKNNHKKQKMKKGSQSEPFKSLMKKLEKYKNKMIDSERIFYTKTKR